MSTIKVQNIQHTASSTNAIELASDGSCAVNNTKRQGKNLVDNGAFAIRQRAATSNTTGGTLIDRFAVNFANHDEALTQSHVDVASGTTPYTLGFRRALRITNGNQTSGANANDFVGMNHVIESMNVAMSGWNYNSTSSYISVSFWIKASVSQKYYARLFSSDGTVKVWVIDTGVIAANTWTKITDKIPGHADLQFDLDGGAGLNIQFIPYYGTDFTDNSVPIGSWTGSSGSAQVPDMTTTWWTTNDATFEITGFQIEVGENVTDFMFETPAVDQERCMRYYIQRPAGGGIVIAQTNIYIHTTFPVVMRGAPTVTVTPGAGAAAGIIASAFGFYCYGTLAVQAASYTASAEY
tara:strand:+ start:2727 stop:3782 length:1056 start_codon:yes stop_codon:yes gene_type:complete